MSPIGRILIVVNLVLAAAFLGWASGLLSDQENYKQQLADKSAELAETTEELEGQLADANSKANQATDAQRTFREERIAAEDALERARSEVQDLQNQLDEAQAQVTKLSEASQGFNDTIRELSSSKDRAVERQMEAEAERDDAVAAADEARSARLDAEDTVDARDNNIVELEIALNDASKRVSALETQLATLIDVTGVDPATVAAQPMIEGAVISALAEQDFTIVALNVGSEQDVSRGLTFEVFDGSTYKGQVRVETVDRDKSTAIVVRAVPGTAIGQGDRVATRL
jgi:predicted RNase H-like nuclease (RuvC/YqgF family)